MRLIFLVSAFAAALIGCSPQGPEQPADPPPLSSGAQGFVLAFDENSQIAAPEGSPVRIEANEAGLILQGHVANAQSGGRTDGASFPVGLANEVAFSGQRIRVTFRARGLDGATAFESAYSTYGDGNSGWRTLELGAAPSEVSYELNVPTMRTPRDDFVGINPPQQGAVQIEWVRIDVVAGPPQRP